jgi:hypothetical protein
VSTRDVVRRYGDGDTTVDALHAQVTVAAAVLPARRTARLNVLDAVQYE